MADTVQSAGVEPAAAVPLRRNRNFLALWIGAAAAFLGLSVAEIAFPLIILARTGSPGLVGVFALVQTGCSVVIGLPAGRLLDRYDRRVLLVLAECGRALAAASVLAALWAGHLYVAHLLAVAAVLGGLQAFGVARMLLLRSVVPGEQLTAAVTAEEVRTNAADLGGPALGGFLYGLSQLLPFAVVTATFAVSTVLALLVRVPSTPRSARPGPGERNHMFSGLLEVMREPTMRAVVLIIMLVNGIAWPAQLVAVVLLQHRQTPSWQIGLALAGFAAGGLAGTALVKPLHRLLRPGVLLIVVVLAEVPVLLGLSSPGGLGGPVWIGAMCFAFGLGLPSIRVLIDVLIIRQIPDALRGRALGGVITLFTLSVPAGMGLSGVLLTVLAPVVVPVVLAAVLLAGLGYAASRRVIWRSRWPSDTAK